MEELTVAARKMVGPFYTPYINTILFSLKSGRFKSREKTGMQRAQPPYRGTLSGGQVMGCPQPLPFFGRAGGKNGLSNNPATG